MVFVKDRHTNALSTLNHYIQQNLQYLKLQECKHCTNTGN